MGCGSTIAAAESVGYLAIGVEKYEKYYSSSLKAVPILSKL